MFICAELKILGSSSVISSFFKIENLIVVEYSLSKFVPVLSELVARKEKPCQWQYGTQLNGSRPGKSGRRLKFSTSMASRFFSPGGPCFQLPEGAQAAAAQCRALSASCFATFAPASLVGCRGITIKGHQEIGSCCGRVLSKVDRALWPIHRFVHSEGSLDASVNYSGNRVFSVGASFLFLSQSSRKSKKVQESSSLPSLVLAARVLCKNPCARRLLRGIHKDL